ncbi:hypothetical protein MSAS_32620 [Mycobacterium saskatchewanense]|uniref:Uncharacterized protein n=1 Tax=Mycobacterium saskatchewanense TaxID=220927 RepID=A0A7I7LVU7_9MYCO|nr:hypothetical protein [Mycobacterium saskatchewanense]BBX64088.1 hypothetical protein MSAS_32620 [Mycobacterium saskatchewanense]
MGSEEGSPPERGEPNDEKPRHAAADDGEAATEPSGTEPSPDSGEEESAEYPSGGSIRYQDAETSRPRPPKPAELRARKKYEDKQREIEEARLEAEAKRQKRNRRLIGGAAAIGVVGVVAGLGYWALSPSTVTAQCVQDDPTGQPVIVPDSYCTGHTAGLNGFFFFGGHQYRYYYGSSGPVGSRPLGGTTVAPKGATITTKSGSTIQRGGFGSKLGGGSGKGGGS